MTLDFGNLYNLTANERLRQTGRTTAMAEAVKKTKGVLICANAQQAALVKKKFGIETTHLGVKVESLYGSDKPLFFDNFAIEELLRRASRVENTLTLLEADVATLAATAKGALEDMKERLGRKS